MALYDTLGAEAMEYIVNQVDMEFIVASPDKVANISRLKDKLPTIKTVIAMDDAVKQEDKDAAAKAGLVLHTFQDVEKLGQGLTEEEHAGPEPDDIATICYTR